MSLQQSRGLAMDKAGVLSLSINQDGRCVALGTLHGIRIVNLSQGRTLFTEDCGAIRIAEMLFCTSVLAYVGAGKDISHGSLIAGGWTLGEQPHLSPRKLTLMNTSTASILKSSMFRSTILGIRMNLNRLVVVLEMQAVVYELESLQKLKQIDTPSNPQGICAMSTEDIPCYLALPSSSECGSVRLFDLLTGGGNLRLEIDAHKSPLSILKFNSDATMIATASEKGTLIHVFSVPDGEKIYTLRRGSIQASILSLAFTPEECNPRLLAVAGSHGTIHIFKLTTNHLTQTVLSQAASTAVKVLTAVTSLPFDTMVEAERSCVTIALPAAAIQTCSFSSFPPDRSEDLHSAVSDNAVLYIVSSDGNLYEYTITGLLMDGKAKAERTREVSLMGSQGILD